MQGEMEWLGVHDVYKNSFNMDEGTLLKQVLHRSRAERWIQDS